MKFGTQNKSNMLIMSIIIGIDDLDSKLWIWANLVPKLKCVPIFYEIWCLEQIERANYEYSTRN